MKSRAAGVSYLRAVPSTPYTERRQTSAPAGATAILSLPTQVLGATTALQNAAMVIWRQLGMGCQTWLNLTPSNKAAYVSRALNAAQAAQYSPYRVGLVGYYISTPSDTNLFQRGAPVLRGFGTDQINSLVAAIDDICRAQMRGVAPFVTYIQPAGLIDYSQLTDPFAATLGAAVDSANTDVTGTADVGGGKTASQDTTIGGTDYAAIGALINSIGRLGISVAQTVMTQMNAQQALDMQRAALAAAAQLRSQGQTTSASQADMIAALSAQRANASSTGISTTTLALGAVVVLGAVYLMTRSRPRRNPTRGRRRRRSY